MQTAWTRGRVKKLLTDEPTIQEAEVVIGDDLSLAVNYPPLTGKISAGDEVMLNTTAVRLNLGTGGRHFVSGILSSRRMLQDRAERGRGHMMKLRYTPMQVAVKTCEEPYSDEHERFCEELDLDSMPVVLCELHSMVPVIAWLLKQRHPEMQLAYMMTDGGALPLAFSRHVRTLRRLGILQGTVTSGHAFGGDVEAVNAYTGLLALKHVLKAEVAIVSMGPGHAGTGTIFGYSGIEQGEMVNRVSILGGTPMFVPRIGFHDPRARHRGVSHHSLTALLRIALREAVVPWPVFQSEAHRRMLEKEAARIEAVHRLIRRPVRSIEEIRRRLAGYPEEIKTMGKTIGQAPAFFQNLAVAADAVSGWYEGEH